MPRLHGVSWVGGEGMSMASDIKNNYGAGATGKLIATINAEKTLTHSKNLIDFTFKDLSTLRWAEGKLHVLDLTPQTAGESD